PPHGFLCGQSYGKTRHVPLAGGARTCSTGPWVPYAGVARSERLRGTPRRGRRAVRTPVDFLWRTLWPASLWTSCSSPRSWTHRVGRSPRPAPAWVLRGSIRCVRESVSRSRSRAKWTRPSSPMYAVSPRRSWPTRSSRTSRSTSPSSVLGLAGEEGVGRFPLRVRFVPVVSFTERCGPFHFEGPREGSLTCRAHDRTGAQEVDAWTPCSR